MHCFLYHNRPFPRSGTSLCTYTPCTVVIGVGFNTEESGNQPPELLIIQFPIKIVMQYVFPSLFAFQCFLFHSLNFPYTSSYDSVIPPRQKKVRCSLFSWSRWRFSSCPGCAITRPDCSGCDTTHTRMQGSGSILQRWLT